MMCSLSTTSVQCLIYMSKAIILFAFVTRCWSVDQPNEFMCINRIHHCTHTYVLRIGHSMSDIYHVLLELLHVKVMLIATIRIYSLTVITWKVRATWFMVVTYLLRTIATKMERLHFANGIFHCNSLQSIFEKLFTNVWLPKILCDEIQIS